MQTHNNRKGSISLEITIVIPAVIVLLMTYIWQLSILRNEMTYRSIMIKESEKIAVAGLAYEWLGGTEAFQAILDGNENTEKVLEDEIYRGILENAVRSHYQSFLQNRMHFTAVLRPMEFYVERSVTGYISYFTSVYSMTTPFGKKIRSFTIPLRPWCRGDGSGKIGKASSSNVWDLDNFERGRQIRIRFGGNLPFGYPVLSGYITGNALVIKSMDLTKDTWSEPGDVYEQVLQEVGDFLAFEGTGGPWGTGGIDIRPEYITGRMFKLIIPENSDSGKYEAAFRGLASFCRSRSVDFYVIAYQKSGMKEDAFPSGSMPDPSG